MEYTTVLECMKEFVEYLCATDPKKYGKSKEYNLEEMDFIKMRWTLDSLYNKFLLSGSYSINQGSPIVHSYNLISDMLDRIRGDELTSKKEELEQLIYKLEKILNRFKKVECESDEENRENGENGENKENGGGWFS